MSYAIPDAGFDLIAHFVSDVGCVREVNQDVAGIFEGEHASRGCLLMVADGMGGAAAGDVASRLALDTVSKTYFDPDYAELQPGVALTKALEVSNSTIFTRSTEDISLSGMGTTCTAIAVVGRDYFVAHVGDSRAYIVHDHEIRQVTDDHSLVAELRRRAGDSELAGSVPPNVLTRCMGVQREVDIENEAHPNALLDGMTMVLCSDGLSNMVDDDVICEVVSNHDPDAACMRLVDLARERGGPDNITILVARVSST